MTHCETCPVFCKECFHNSLTPLYWLFFTGKYEHRKLKTIVGFIYGITLGIGLYLLILIDLDFTEDAAFVVSTTICLMLGFGIAFSSQIRCISSLAIPSLCGKAGRSVLRALVIAYLISGPIENIAVNGKEVVRVFSCTTSLTFNLTKTRFELMFKPFTDALFGMKADINEVKDTLRSIKDVSAPLTGELEGEEEMRKLKEENDYMDESLGDSKKSSDLDAKYASKGEEIEAKRFEKKYLEKIELRCENQFTKAGNKCRAMFQKGYDTCYEIVTWFAGWLLCWPMKIDFICNIVQALGGASRCDPAKDIGTGFGEGYSYLKNSGKDFYKNFKDVKMQYKLPKVKQLQDIRDAKDTAKAVLHTVEVKKGLLDGLFVIIKRILAFAFLVIIIKAQQYHDKYLRDIDFNNVFVTKYFRKIDARRKHQGKHVLLPLKKAETQILIAPFSLKPLKKERRIMIIGLIMLVLELLLALIFILLDHLFYVALDIIRRHGKIDYYQTGRHDFRLEIIGTGMIASILRSLVKGFNIKKRIKIHQSNVHCLPQPSKLKLYYYLKIFGTYFMILLFIFGETYTQRFYRVICAYFYRKREKTRVLYLYNETLRRRIGYFKFMKKKVEKTIRQDRLRENFNCCTVLRVRYPKQCDFLRVFPMARRKCLICQEVEPLFKSKFVVCPNPECHYVHCEECFDDMGRVCLACTTYESDTSGIDGEPDDDDL